MSVCVLREREREREHREVSKDLIQEMRERERERGENVSKSPRQREREHREVSKHLKRESALVRARASEQDSNGRYPKILS